MPSGLIHRSSPRAAVAPQTWRSGRKSSRDSIYLAYVEPFLLCLKDPAFEAERVWRLVCNYRPDYPTCMCFRQRRSNDVATSTASVRGKVTNYGRHGCTVQIPSTFENR